MRSKAKFVGRIAKHLPILHREYREMCSLAAVGQLGGPQMCELNEHIATCLSCRKFLESVSQASVQVLPVLAEDRIPTADVVPPSGMRARFLSRLVQESFEGTSDSLRIAPGEGEACRGENARELVVVPEDNRGPQTPTSTKISNETPGGEPSNERLSRPIGARNVATATQRSYSDRSMRLWPIAAVAAAAVVALTGFYLGRKTLLPRQPQVVAAVPAHAAYVRTLPSADDRVANLEREKILLQTQLTELQTALTDAKANQESLRNELVAANKKLVALPQAQTTAQETSIVQESKTRVTLLESETERLRQRLADSETALALQQRTTQEVSEKLQLAEMNLQRELSLKDAKNQMGELVAARNLHIVDVFDADPSGKRQRAFGRVFYTEGKSLVFYAYDLEDAHQLKANVVFHVWGGKAGVKEVTHSLGILRKDDAGESRWAMTFDDPSVLSQINSVFVTAETANKHYDEPHGKKVLFAYFGSQPNHP